MAYIQTGGLPTPIENLTDWAKQYKEQNIEIGVDNSMFDLVSPDDSILIAGPSRLYHFGNFKGEYSDDNDEFYIIGVCQAVNFSETSQIQPFKAIGSRRHMFTKSSTPVQASIGRMMFHGKNLARALYTGVKNPGSEDPNINNKYAQGVTYAEAHFLTNLEEDLYRYPFGLGIIYHTPKTAHDGSGGNGQVAVAAEYLECCYLQSRNVSIQSGQTVVMEQVQIMADRVVPWDSFYKEPPYGTSQANR